MLEMAVIETVGLDRFLASAKTGLAEQPIASLSPNQNDLLHGVAVSFDDKSLNPYPCTPTFSLRRKQPFQSYIMVNAFCDKTKKERCKVIASTTCLSSPLALLRSAHPGISGHGLRFESNDSCSKQQTGGFTSLYNCGSQYPTSIAIWYATNCPIPAHNAFR